MSLRAREHVLQLRAWIALALALVAAAATVGARDLMPGIVGTDDRKLVDRPGPPWDAIGQVNIGGYRRLTKCTGTLVAADVVVTAAHCVVDPATGRPFADHRIHFVPGIRAGAGSAHSVARCVRLPDGYTYLPRSSMEHAQPMPGRLPRLLADDVAAIILKDALPIPPIAITEAEPQGAVLAHAAYAADRRYALSVHEGCAKLERPGAEPLWATDCDTHPASSGGPLLVSEDGEMRLAATMLAVVSHRFNLALPARLWRGFMTSARCD